MLESLVTESEAVIFKKVDPHLDPGFTGTDPTRQGATTRPHPHSKLKLIRSLASAATHSHSLTPNSAIAASERARVWSLSMEAAGGAARGFRRRVPEPGWWVLRAVERSLRRRLSRAVAAWLPATVVVGWVTAVAGIAPIVGRWVGGEVGRAMEVAGVHVVGAGQHVFMLLVVPIAVLLMVMQLRLLAGPLMGGRGMVCRKN